MRRIRRRRNPNYLLPFLVFVGVGIIGVLAFQIWNFFFVVPKGDALFYVIEGRAKTLPFGASEWENAFNGTKIKLGDSLKTPVAGKAVIKFYDDTILRMGDDTEITLVDITKKSDHAEILLTLQRGMIWVNKPKTENIKTAEFVVNTNYAVYNVTGTIFDIEKSNAESLRVWKGKVKVDIVEKGDNKNNVIESIDVAMGQEVNLDEAVMNAFYQRQTPSVLKIIDDAVKTTAWYTWNTKEDEQPSDLTKIKADTGSNETTETEDTQVNTETAGNTPATTDNAADTTDTDTSAVQSTLEAPTITNPQDASMTTETGKVTISGTVPVGTKKIYVLQKLGNSSKEEKIFLTKYKAGDTSWTYNVSETLKNIQAGENSYSFVGLDENELETAASTLTVNYNKKKVEISDPLIAPNITKVDGKAYSDNMVVTSANFRIEGSVQGAEKVLVNEYSLSQFTPGSKVWAYNIKESLGNLKPGSNTYKVYAVDPDGIKSEVKTITINYEKSAVDNEQNTSSTSTSTTPASSGSASTSTSSSTPTSNSTSTSSSPSSTSSSSTSTDQSTTPNSTSNNSQGSQSTNTTNSSTDPANFPSI